MGQRYISNSMAWVESKKSFQAQKPLIQKEVRLTFKGPQFALDLVKAMSQEPNFKPTPP